MNNKVDLLFNPGPEQWGLRGDPLLWTDLENHMRDSQLPDSLNDFKKLLFDLFENLVGEKLVGNKSIYIEKYEHIGMSSGMISSKFWIRNGFPLLLERFNRISHVPNTEMNGA